MSATYSQIPPSVRDIFEPIVTEVSDNLASDTSLDIDSVTYYCETWLELINRLNKEGQAGMTRYPFIALIRNWELSYDGTIHPDTKLTFVVCTNSTAQKYSEDRESENYEPILRPIWAEFLACMKNSTGLLGYNIGGKYNYMESLHLGTDSPDGNKKYMLPDVVDGIIVTDFEVKLNGAEDCLPTTIGPSLTRIVYLNNVSSLTIAGIQSTDIRVQLVEAQYTDYNNLGFGTSPEYSVYLEHSTYTAAITVGETLSIPLGDSPTDGDYYGYISCDDTVQESRLYFWYGIRAGRLGYYTDICKFKLRNFTLTGEQYTDYPFNVDLQYYATLARFSRYSLSIDGGNEMASESYAPLAITTGIDTITVSEPLATSYRDVILSVTIGDDTLDSIAYYKIQ